MSIKLLTEHHLEFLRLKGDCTGSSESTLVNGNRMSCLNYLTVIGPFDASLLTYLRTFTLGHPYNPGAGRGHRVGHE